MSEILTTPTVTKAEPPPQELDLREQALRHHLLGMLRAITPKAGITYEQFLDWADEDTLAEWVKGEVVMTSPASEQHQDIGDFIVVLLRLFVERRRLGRIISAPFQMKLADSGREPDLLFVSTAHLGRVKRTYLEGPADLVVEIISPESVGRDRGDKFYEYEAGGVPEYWMIDPQRRWADFYRLEEGRYRLIHAGADGVVRFQSIPDFWLRVEWLWQQPLPFLDDILRELGMMA